LLLALFVGYGVARGNDLMAISKELTALCYVGFFLILGGDDRFWAYLSKPLTVLFYAGAILVVAFANTPIVQAVGDEVRQDLTAPVAVAHRNILSLGYTLRPLMASGLFLGVWGLVNRQRGLWRCLQISAPIVLFACEVGLFLFRSAGAYVLLAGVSCLVLRPFFERRAQARKSIVILATAAIGITIFAATSPSDYLLTRISEDTRENGLFESRNTELREYLDQAGWGVLLGRGVGGTFDASNAYLGAGRSYDRESFSSWNTLHYGVLAFGLKGGIVMLALFVSMLTPGLRRRGRQWYKNPCNLTAALLFPTSVVMVITDPLLLGVEGLLFMLVLMAPLSRFGRRGVLDMKCAPVFGTGFERPLA